MTSSRLVDKNARKYRLFKNYSIIIKVIIAKDNLTEKMKLEKSVTKVEKVEKIEKQGWAES